MKSNTRFTKNKKGIECLNCKQPISTTDNFCSNCGQVNDTKPLSLIQYITELLGGFFAFDTRTLNTLIPLLTKPGKVSKDYIDGKRMQYVNPFQLYLHASIIFFLFTGIFMSIDNYKEMVSTNKSLKKEKEAAGIGSIVAMDSVKKDSTNILQQVLKQSKDLVNDTIFLKTIKNSKLSIKKKDEIIQKLIIDKMSSLYSKYSENDSFEKDSLYDYDKFAKAYMTNFQKEIIIKKIDYKVPFNDYDNNIETSSPWLKKYTHFFNSKTKNVEKALDSLGYKKTSKNIFFFKKLQEFKKVTKGGDAGKSFLNNMISKSSIIMFFMLPLFTLFLSLVYIRNKNTYTEHLVFVFNIQTVFFILLLIGIIIDRIFDIDLGISVFLLGFLFYLYKAMRKFYNQRRIKTIIKFIILNFVYLLLSLFGLMTVAFLAIII